MTAAKSAYPVPVEELLPQAEKLAADLGELPSRNRLMSELRIGAKKANKVLALLSESSTEAPDPVRLHLVTEPDSAEDDEQPAEPTSEENDTEQHSVQEPPEPGPADHDDPEPPTADERPEPVHTEHFSDHANPEPPVIGKPVPRWPVLLLALPAFVAIWSGWVGLGGLTGFGIVHPLPGIWSGFEVNTAITLPIGVETYAAYALRVWLSGRVPHRARRFAKVSALGSLCLGALGQIAYHLMTAAGMSAAPWWITTLVACLPVAVLGMGAALTHLLHTDDQEVSR